METVKADDETANLTGEAAQLQRVRDGDREAFTQIVTAHWDEAARFARHLVGRPDAEDLTSDVFERLFAALVKGLGPREAVRPYLFRMIRNAAIDQYRHRREAIEGPGMIDEGSELDEHNRVLESRLVRNAFLALPTRWQQVLWLYYVEQHDRSEISAELGLRPGAVSQLALRAREAFRAAYLAEYARFVDDDGTEHPTELLASYVTGRACPGDVARVRDHLRTCQPCSDAVVEMRAMTKGLRATLLVVIGPILGSLGWRLALAGDQPGGTRLARWGRQVPALSTAAVTIVVGGLLGLDYARRTAESWAEPGTLRADATARARQRTPVALASTTPTAAPAGPTIMPPQTARPSSIAKAAPPRATPGPGHTPSPMPSPAATTAPTLTPTPTPMPTPPDRPTPTAPATTPSGGDPTTPPLDQPSWEQPAPSAPPAIPVPIGVDPKMPPEYVEPTMQPECTDPAMPPECAQPTP